VVELRVGVGAIAIYGLGLVGESHCRRSILRSCQRLAWEESTECLFRSLVRLVSVCVTCRTWEDKRKGKLVKRVLDISMSCIVAPGKISSFIENKVRHQKKEKRMNHLQRLQRPLVKGLSVLPQRSQGSIIPSGAASPKKLPAVSGLRASSRTALVAAAALWRGWFSRFS